MKHTWRVYDPQDSSTLLDETKMVETAPIVGQPIKVGGIQYLISKAVKGSGELEWYIYLGPAMAQSSGITFVADKPNLPYGNRFR